MKNIVLIGSTGSIGTQTLDIVRAHRDELTITALAAGRNVEKMEEQIREFSPLMACLYDESAAADLKERVRDLPVRIVCGMDGLLEEAELAESDLFLNAVVGMIGIRPTLAAIHAGKTIALANKETLVTAGHLIIPAVKEAGVQLLPVDSEHSAIFQCMNGEPKRRVKKILLTCSGGTFRGKKREELVNMTAKDALKNPNWSMGNKVTIDSASLVNKGLEVMEATWLFGVPASRIEVLVQPQSICHSAVEYVDGSIIAHLASPDMHQPIQYALFWPDRRELDMPELDLLSVGDVHFEKPDTDTFRGLPLAYRASEAGGSMPTVFNAANEEAVSLFMKDRIHFLDIYDLIEAAMDEHSVVPNPSLEEVLAVGEEARQSVRRYAEKISS
ncbi:MAG: 1-deoxy-D-xylulose-5-phosphate reductoisomerase [Lachnospiraceae bacterium]|jgi:1-deoxy-D-xylulose-5-phosphate reductoisomerase|nr:1-deoxy-D-xylulose-5-phosphate reductoisomerase [Lachnospiraceae bacterium]MCH4027675.1 1-deoxy-D-xylulose-5-phosphate reductoisomerase [Lachnospiraceae bacterium]MCH4065516.1 1-deoxy-D-xylulose-5-phosphate reductoisomerase [Lachnospiraceae bacterium]MCH4111555.1 1-deoxy-D-xylulose-5-phosphate reductoisomerase [Lachnospiraceae bacterium]MCI1352890.1 1-deoxy-D-xylulose-5-phosphate reductoisomerase [Lachnospiraceae bacterium]